MAENVIYESLAIYRESAHDLKEEYRRVKLVYNALLDLIASGAANEGTESYSINDGQSTINLKYRSINSILQARKELRMEMIDLQNQINGRAIRLVDRNNLQRGRTR